MTPDPLGPTERLPARALRFLPKGECLVEITMRALHGRPLLKPTKQATAAILGVLGRSLHLHPEIKIVGFWFLSNHYTMLLRTSSQTALSRFENHLNGNIAKEIGRQIGWTEKYWGRRYQSIYVGMSDETQEGRFRYLLAQGTKEGLVARPEDWLGACSLLAHTQGKKLRGVWYDRTKEYEANRRRREDSKEPRKQFPTTYEIPIAPLPCWDELTPEERRKRSREIVREIEATTRRKRRGKPAVGMKKIMRANPHRRPKTVASSPAPLSHGNRHERDSYRDFYVMRAREYRAAAVRLRGGDVSAWNAFPPGSFPPPIPPGMRLGVVDRSRPRRTARTVVG
jgi:hypothetical protein